MGRPRPYVVESVWHPITRVAVTVCYDRQRRDYYAEIGKDTIRGEQAADVVGLVERALADGKGLDWRRAIIFAAALQNSPVRCVRELRLCASDPSKSVVFGFAFFEAEVTQRDDGVLLWRRYEPPPVAPLDEEEPPPIPPLKVEREPRALGLVDEAAQVLEHSTALWGALEALSVKYLEQFAALRSFAQIRAPLDPESIVRALLEKFR